jgi:hypothetical protein
MTNQIGITERGDAALDTMRTLMPLLLLERLNLNRKSNL